MQENIYFYMAIEVSQLRFNFFKSDRKRKQKFKAEFKKYI